MSLTAVLLPGLDGSGAQFAPLVQALGRHMPTQVVAYSKESTSYSENFDQALAVMPDREPYILVAESYSGPIAIKIAAQRPEGLRGLVLCASFAKCPNALLSQLSFLLPAVPPLRVPVGWLAPFVLGRYTTANLLELLETALSTVEPRVLLERLRGVATFDATTEARAIDVPTLYLRASSDRLVPASAGKELSLCISGMTLRDLEGPHFLLQASAEAASEEIRSFASARIG